MFSLKQKEINNLKANFLLILLLTLFSTYFWNKKNKPVGNSQRYWKHTPPPPNLAIGGTTIRENKRREERGAETTTRTREGNNENSVSERQRGKHRYPIKARARTTSLCMRVTWYRRLPYDTRSTPPPPHRAYGGMPDSNNAPDSSHTRTHEPKTTRNDTKAVW